jgi:hypothetical protein
MPACLPHGNSPAETAKKYSQAVWWVNSASYSIRDAVADGAVVPLLYEGRHHVIEVNDTTD